MSDEQKLTDSEIAELRANHKEKDHWKWLLKMLHQLALWTVVVVAEAHALIEKGGGIAEVAPTKPMMIAEFMNRYSWAAWTMSSIALMVDGAF